MSAKQQKQDRANFGKALAFLLKNLRNLDLLVTVSEVLAEPIEEIKDLSIKVKQGGKTYEYTLKKEVDDIYYRLLSFLLKVMDKKQIKNEKRTEDEGTETPGRLSN